ncbi:MAG: hypothetical protein OXF68_04800 [Gammaproteobacteria bacterium]|nr:hypothetical protein [Gammaproteobacteria bacterium]
MHNRQVVIQSLPEDRLAEDNFAIVDLLAGGKLGTRIVRVAK